MKCPKCGASLGDILYVTRDYTYHAIEEVHLEGIVDLKSVEGSFPDESFTPKFNCGNCDHEWDAL